MNAFTIKDLENLSGVKAHTIRIWEQRYSFLCPQRTSTNIRYYTSDELKKVLNIALLNKYGYKISHINKMDEEQIREKLIDLSGSEAQQERLVNELIQYMIDLSIDEFETVLDNFILSRGIDKAITYLIFPFLEKIGILWLTSHISAAQEHLVTNVIRQKLIVGIESAVSSITTDQTVLLFLPEGEHHELGLLYMYYLLKSRGMKVIYLGANVPTRDIEYISRLKKPDFLYTHLTAVAGNFNVERFLQQVHRTVPQVPLAVSGQFTAGHLKKVPEGIYLKRSLLEVLELITTRRA